MCCVCVLYMYSVLDVYRHSKMYHVCTSAKTRKHLLEILRRIEHRVITPCVCLACITRTGASDKHGRENEHASGHAVG